ncbi:MAG: DUF1353 domain-containing protein, partial [Acidimicrobiia bacterium]|nr:DUF1353 domain-containing protein [Acidimicrobiia bacterium]
KHADYLFREAMKQSAVPWLRRWLMWAAVALRTLTVKITKSPDGTERQTKRWSRIIPLALVVTTYGLLSAAMALDVPDLRPSSGRPGSRGLSRGVPRVVSAVRLGREL